MAPMVEQQTGAWRAHGTGHPGGGAIGSGADRSRDFRRAKRHSRVVAAMRYALPLAALSIAGVYFSVVAHKSGWISGLPDAQLPKILPEHLTMHDPRYEGFNADGGRYVVTARTAQQSLTDINLVTLGGIEGYLIDASQVRTDLKAKSGVFNNGARLLELTEEIDIVSGTGFKARLKSATVEIKDSIVSSEEPVAVEMTAGRVEANAMRLRHKAREVTFSNGVHTFLNGRDAPARPDTAAKIASPASRAFGTQSGPIDVVSDRLDVNDTTKLAVFSGNVRATQGGATIEAPDLHVSYAGRAPGLPTTRRTPAEGEPNGEATAAAAPDQGRVQRITATGPLVMTQTTGERATSDTADFDAESQRAYLAGHVVMTQLPDRRVSSDQAEIDQRAESVLLTGNVVLTQGKNEIRGQRLTSDRKSGRTRVVSPGGGAGGAPGRVAARFVRGTSAAAPGAAPLPVVAGGAAGGLGTSFKTDPAAPVDIDSDSLDINDGRKTAVFAGDVKAVQGEMTLRTAELTAFYSGEAGLTDASRNEAGGKGGADLQRIEARRAVVMQGRDGQTATGDWATFDTKKNTVIVGGEVVLTSGPNVVRGSRLVIDMTTGQSVIETDPAAAWSARAQPTPTAGTTGAAIEVPAVSGRPSAIFYPKRLNERTKPGETAKGAAPKSTDAIEAWGPQTTRGGGASN